MLFDDLHKDLKTRNLKLEKPKEFQNPLEVER